MLMASALFLVVSKRLKSAVAFGRWVPPRMDSRATEVEAVDFRGHDPYQLPVCRTFRSVSANAALLGLPTYESPAVTSWLVCVELLALVPSAASSAWETEGVVEPAVFVDAAELATFDEVREGVAFFMVVSVALDDSEVASAGFGFARFLGPIATGKQTTLETREVRMRWASPPSDRRALYLVCLAFVPPSC